MVVNDDEERLQSFTPFCTFHTSQESMLNCLSPYIQCGLNKKGHSWTANDEEIEAAATAPQTQSASVLPTGYTYNHTGWLSLSLSLCVCRRERIKGESICTSLL